MKHTKGKWATEEWFGETCIINKVKGQRQSTICKMAINEEAEANANAKLIAAAPELLEALTEIKEQADGYGVINHTWLNSLCSEAIKKAS